MVAPGARVARPRSVTAAALMLVASTIPLFALMAIGLVAQATMKHSGYLRDESALRANALRMAFVLLLLLALGFGTFALAFFTLRGRRGARIGAWVYCGVMALVCMAAVASFASDVRSGQVGSSAPDVLLFVGTFGVNLLLYLGCIVLLAVPASRPFFARRP